MVNRPQPGRRPLDRFNLGVPPGKQGDYAYLLRIVRSLKSTGKAACILPHGVLFRGNAEAGIRENLVNSGLIEGIIGLPANLFYGTGIPACIIVMDKKDAQARRGIYMVDAIKLFEKDNQLQNVVMTDAVAREQAIRHFFSRALREARD